MPSSQFTFNRRLACSAAPAAVLILAISPIAHAVVVADYEDDFQVGTPATGWSYLWNANGPLGDPDNYEPLVPDNGHYETVQNTAYPDAAPGAFLTVGAGPVDPVRFPQNPPPDPFGLGIPLPPLPSTFVRPGQGIDQAPNTIERAAIVAYTFSAPGEAFLTDYYFAVSATADDPISARVYHHDDPTPILDFTFPAGFAFQTALDPDPIPLGTYAAGQTVYIAIGPTFTDANGGDELRMDFTISVVPEPSGALLVTGGMAFLARGRLRR